jgi:hypothetical protein
MTDVPIGGIRFIRKILAFCDIKVYSHLRIGLHHPFRRMGQAKGEPNKPRGYGK